MNLGDLHRLLTDERTGAGSTRWFRLVLLVSPAWMVAAQLGRDLPGPLAGFSRGLVLATLALVVVQRVLGIRHAGGAVAYVRHHAVPFLLLLVQLAGTGLGLCGVVPLFPVVGTVLALDLAGRGFVLLTSRTGARTVPPALVLTVSFLVLIAGGTVVMHSPAVTASGERLSLDEALFTATSAACVTGLSVIDVGRDLSPTGQTVLLLMIQLGGLGLMTLGAFVLVFLDKARASHGARLIGDLLGERRPGHTVALATRIVMLTLALEAVGAVILSILFEDPWKGVFGAVSAFCNAGFFLESTSLEAWRGDVGVNVTVMALVILGGLGFPVLIELGRKIRGRLLGRPAGARLSLSARLVLVTSAALIVVGAVTFWALERDGCLSDLPPGEAALASTFQSVTMRTAGFDTVSFAADGERPMERTTLLVTTGFMSIGASPLSTGGGFKTLTLAVLLLGVLAVVRGRSNITVGRRALAPQVMVKAAAVFVLYAVTFFGATVALLVADGGRHDVLDLLFESCSALGTVGLSTGVTPDLDAGSRVVLAASMFLGRVGPLTIFLLFSVSRPSTVAYPEEDMVVG